MKTNVLVNGVLLSMFLSTACAKTDSEPQAPVADNPEATAMQPSASGTTATSTQSRSEMKFSDAMRIPVDGSSLEAFERSMETIKSQAEMSEFTTLEGALEYLLIYDLGARRDRATLAQRLDGLTGEEIVDKVEWGKTKK